eukprot:gene7085-7298_t
MKEVSFSWGGFNNAMISNLGMVLRNIYSKKSLNDYKAAVSNLGGPAFYQLLGMSGLFYHLYNQASYMVLDQGISPVTFSVGNTMKRVAVVVSSVMFFKNPVSMLNWVGSGVAILGTYLYSLATDKAKEEAKRTSNV